MLCVCACTYYSLVADECGGTDFEAYSETYTFNGPEEGSNTSEKRFQMDLYVCAPFGTYELEMEVRSTNGVDDDGNSRPMERIAWEIEYGADQVRQAELILLLCCCRSKNTDADEL